MKKTGLLVLLFVFFFTSGNICAETLALHADSDTYIDQQYPDSNFGQDWKMLMSGFTTKPAHGLLRFNLSGLPGGARITKARFTILVHTNQATSLFYVHPMTSGWEEDNATWNLAEAGINWTTPGGDFAPAVFVEAGLPGSAPDWMVIDVTPLISDEQGNLNTGTAANGLLLKADAGYNKVLTAGFAGYENALTCHSCHGANDSSRDVGKSTNCSQCHSRGDISLSGEPTLIVDYEPMLFQFVQLSDTHLGKTPQALVNLNDAVAQINGINPAFVLVTGDLTDAGTTDQYSDFKNAMDNLTMAHFCVPGDNDVIDGGTLDLYRQELGADYYAFDYGGFKFIGLNNTDNISLDNTQRQWLQDRLKEGEPGIIFAHEPLLDHYDNSTITGAEQLLDMLHTYQAPLYMNGHTHQTGQYSKDGTAFVWCKNLFYANMGDPYNLYKVYADRILLYHVALPSGSQTFVWTICLNGTCADNNSSTTTTTSTSILTTTTSTSSTPASTTTSASTSSSVSSATTANSTTSSTTSVPATILHVGADWPGSPYATIQAAVDAASDGDEIWVEQGAYTLASTIDVGKAVSLYGGFTGSETSRDQRNWTVHATIVDGDNSVRCFLVYSTITIDGFTITKGDTHSDNSNGAGIWNGKSMAIPPVSGYLTLSNCILSNNSSGNSAGALFSDWGALKVNNCTFSGNTANGARAGAIENYASDMTITNCTFSGNTANNAGAIYFPDTAGSPSATANNVITDCVFSQNTALQDGGAIIGDGNAAITRCVFDRNTATRYGTFAMRGDTGFSAVVTNCIFTGNTAKYGAALCINGSSGMLGVITAMNCTFAGNTLVSGGKGGVIYTMKPSSNAGTVFTVTNSILRGNGGNAIDRSGTTQPLPTVSYTDIDQTGYAGTISNSMNQNPLFAGSSDYHLQGTSPCIDTGTSAGAPSVDIAGTLRPQVAGYDMGAYEYVPPALTTTTTALTTSSTIAPIETSTTTTADSTASSTTTAPAATTSISTTTTTEIESTTSTSSTPASTTTSTHTKLCLAEVVFDNEPATLDLLRRFRDGVLSSTPEGRRWTALYYRNADVIAGLLENNPGLRRQSRAAVERLLPYIGKLVDGKAVDHRAMRLHAEQLIGLYRKKIGADSGRLHTMIMNAATVSNQAK